MNKVCTEKVIPKCATHGFEKDWCECRKCGGEGLDGHDRTYDMPSNTPSSRNQKAPYTPYRYRWTKQCVCGAFLPKPAQGAQRVACGKCGQEHEVGR